MTTICGKRGGGGRMAQPDWIFRGFMLGGLAGTACGLGLVAWYGRVGYPPKYYPQVYVGFWALVGGFIGLSAGILHRLTRGR